MRTLSTYTYRKKLRSRTMQRILTATFFLLIWLLIISINLFDSGVASGESRMPQVITIEKGDTIWALAKTNLPDGTDIRAYIEEIYRYNNLSDPIVYPGQRLVLP